MVTAEAWGVWGRTMFRTDRTRRRPNRLKRLVFFLVAFVLSLLLLARVDTNAASRAAASSAQLAGAFVNWGPVGREQTLQVWEKWLKQRPSSVLGVDFYGEKTWEDFHKMGGGAGHWEKTNTPRYVVW